VVETRPYGAWASPITAASMAGGMIGVSDVRVADGKLYWLEEPPRRGRPHGGDDPRGRRGAPAHARGFQRPHPGPRVRRRALRDDASGLWFSHFRDQKLYRQHSHSAPEAITPEGYRYADAVAAPGGGLIAVREEPYRPG